MDASTIASAADEMYKGLECLYLAAEHSIARDVDLRVRKYVDALKTELAERDAQIAEMRKELVTECEVIKEMRLRAYRVRADVNVAIFEIEQIALTDEKRAAELGLEANDAR